MAFPSLIASPRSMPMKLRIRAERAFSTTMRLSIVRRRRVLAIATWCKTRRACSLTMAKEKIWVKRQHSGRNQWWVMLTLTMVWITWRSLCPTTINWQSHSGVQAMNLVAKIVTPPNTTFLSSMMSKCSSRMRIVKLPSAVIIPTLTNKAISPRS